jgi:hypothetical protein
VLVNAEGQRASYAFDDVRNVTRGDSHGMSRWRYDATLVRQDIYLVDMLSDDVSLAGSAPGLPVSETWALDLRRGLATVVTTMVADRTDGVRWLASDDTHWWLEGTEPGRHERSSGLAGMRILWQYSDTDRYDHVYLNGSSFAWQCVSGTEQGLTELDRTRAYAISDDLYFFGWSEHVQPVESMLFVDLSAMKSYGRMIGWEERSATFVHHQFGAVGTLLNRTTYPPLRPLF